MGTDVAAGAAGTPSDAGSGGATVPVITYPVTISVANKRARTTTWSANYWQWSPSYGDDVAGTESLVEPLRFSVLRAGGYNNDANLPNPFDDAQLDTMVAYARAVGTEPLIQVPLLADTDGMPPTADTAAAMVKYANVTQGYAIKYFSIGNEPDIYQTQGGLQDPTLPAIAGYTPDDYCASATAYVAAMKAVDPTISIIGPDLAYRYIPGTANDWLTPILRTCGALFDVVAVHRYPFSDVNATLAHVSVDAAAFQSSIASVRGIMQATGFANKPLAITEMNVAYDALPKTNLPDAGSGTVPSALWVADTLSTAANLELWTTAIWDLSDSDNYQLGLISQAPAHTPRPEYYAYQLFAQHVGPTLVDVSSAPAGVHAFPTRNADDNGTEVIAINWNTSSRALVFAVTGLTPAPKSAVFTLPGLSIAAIELPDDAAAFAFVYGGAQFATKAGPAPLTPGAFDEGSDVDAGAPDAGNDAAAPVCTSLPLSNPVVTSAGKDTGAMLQFTSDTWGSFTYAATGEPTPTAALTSDGNGFTLAENLTPPSAQYQNYAGFGLYYNTATCIDATAYTGVQFDLSGDLGGCVLSLAAQFSADLSTTDDAVRGSCNSTSSQCYPPTATVTGTGTVKVPFASMIAGSPVATVDVTSIVSLTWQLTTPSDGDSGACSASFSVANAAFY